MRRAPGPLVTLIVVLATLAAGGHAAQAATAPDPAATSAGQWGACAALNAQTFASPDCDAEMAAFPAPPAAALAVDHGTVANYTFMRVVSDGATLIRNAPGGAPAYVLDAGFHFVTPRQVTEDWVEINPGEWVERGQLQYVEPSHFTGVFIQAEPPYPFGWVLKTSYTSDHPGGAPIETPEHRVNRYQLVNVYSAVPVDGWNWYLIAPGQWIEQKSMGVARRIAPPTGVGGRWVAIDLYEQTLVAYDGGAMVFATLVSSGLPQWSTREGTFQVWGRNANGEMSGAEGQPDYYRLENVPYALYFDGNISLHGTYWHNGFGYRHSHGCVNLSISDAHWLYDWLGVGGGVYVYYSRAY